MPGLPVAGRLKAQLAARRARRDENSGAGQKSRQDAGATNGKSLHSKEVSYINGAKRPCELSTGDIFSDRLALFVAPASCRLSFL